MPNPRLQHCPPTCPLRPLPIALRGSTAPFLSSTAHSQFIPLPPPTGLASPQPSPLKGRPPHPPPSSLSSWALACPSGHCSKAQPLRPCTGSGLRFLPFRTQPPITYPCHRPISNHVPSALPQLISSAVLTPMDTRRPRRRRIYNCSLCTRGSWRGAGWGRGTRARAVSVGERRGGRSGEGSWISPPPYLRVHFPNLPLFPAVRGSSFCPTTTPAARLTAAAASSGQDGRRAPWRLADRTAAWVGLIWVRSGFGLGA